MKNIAIFGLFVTLVVGCGGGDSGPAAKMGTVNPAGAKSVVMQTSEMKKALDAKNGATLSAQVQSIALAGAQQIVQPAGAAPILLPAEGTVPLVAGADPVCDDAGCTFNNYMVGTTTYNGSIKSTKMGEGGQVVADLTITVAASAQTGGTAIDYHVTGPVNFTATSVDGSLQTDGTSKVMAGGMTITSEYDNLVKYNAVVLSNGIATGGSIYAKWSVSVSGAPQGSQAWEGTVTFP